VADDERAPRTPDGADRPADDGPGPAGSVRAEDDGFGRELAGTETPPAHQVNWGTRLLGGLIVAVALVVLVLIGAAVLPRWWAHRIGQVSDGSLTAGIAAGLFCGVVFTALPLLALRGTVRRHRSWTARFSFLLVAGLLGAPNLLTLGIVLGNGNAAHAGERTLDVDAPGFRDATLAGAVIGALLVIAYWVLMANRRRRKREIVSLKQELRRRDEPPAEVEATDQET
jgi:hypothetical protein